jgi:N-acetylneuraminate synthase
MLGIKMPEIMIAGRSVGNEYLPYLIAELSANHNGSLKTALQLLEEAKRVGADAVKLQTYRPDTMTLQCNKEQFRINKGPWSGQTLYELYEKAHMPWDWHIPLFERAGELGITIFSSPFDLTAIDFLESLNAPAYKIASFEIVDLPLIRYAANTGKPLIISTGLANAEEIRDAIEAAIEGGCKQLAILHCVSGYPASAEDYNLRTIPDMFDRFGLVTGLSDHTLDNTTAIASVAMGASIIEKHFTIDRSVGGADSEFSLEPSEFQDLCITARAAWRALGKVDYKPKPSEQENAIFRRSIYFIRDLLPGEKITMDAIRVIRPGYGLKPKYLQNILGKSVNRGVERGDPVTWDLIQ